VTLDADEEETLARGVDVVGLEGARADVALAAGDPARALDHALRAGAVMSAVGWEVHIFSWRHPGARAYAALGRTDEARAVAEDAVALARRWAVPSYVSEALRTLAAVDPARRLASLQEAVALVDGSPRRLEVAHAHVALGLAQLEAGGDAQARVTLRAGLDAAEASGASALAGRARAGLRAAGGRPRRARTTGAAALTPAELRVARLAAAGSTNREIAEQLFVTVKAVKFHLGNTYRKLAISSRSELAAALRDG
jgi:DNA-binding CsgD family transcriptional regulator